jgi:hypothetical protein
MIRRSTGTSLLLAEAGAGVVSAEGIDHAARRRVVNHAALVVILSPSADGRRIPALSAGNTETLRCSQGDSCRPG